MEEDSKSFMSSLETSDIACLFHPDKTVKINLQTLKAQCTKCINNNSGDIDIKKFVEYQMKRLSDLLSNLKQ